VSFFKMAATSTAKRQCCLFLTSFPGKCVNYHTLHLVIIKLRDTNSR